MAHDNAGMRSDHVGYHDDAGMRSGHVGYYNGWGEMACDGVSFFSKLGRDCADVPVSLRLS